MKYLGIILKKNVMIRIDGDIVEKVKEIGLNVSKVSENALKDMIICIQGSETLKKDEPRLDEDEKWGRPDLNRGPERPRLRA